MSVYLNNWSDLEDVCNDFCIDAEKLNKYNVLLASYTCEDYSGDAFVLLQDKETKALFEVNGSHCSCDGLEHQWDPEPSSKDEIEYRVNKGTLGTTYYGDEFTSQLKQVLSSL